MKIKNLFSFLFIGLLITSCQPTETMQEDTIDPVASLYSNTQVIGDIVYKTIEDQNLRLDIYVPTLRLGGPPDWVKYTDDLKPTLLFLHGGGWQGGDKISRSLYVLPYVQKGFVVVTANYRHLPDTYLPAIIGDTRAALNWIYENADKYKMDTDKIVISGESAGGHLALMGVIDDETLFPQEDELITRNMSVAAIVNWFGVTDLNLANEHWDENRGAEVTGVSSGNAEEIKDVLTLCSPYSYLDTEIPPIISIHGSEDVSARYEQSVKLHEKLEELGTKNTFITINGKKHGNFDPREMTMATKEIWKFLGEVGVL